MWAWSQPGRVGGCFHCALCSQPVWGQSTPPTSGLVRCALCLPSLRIQVNGCGFAAPAIWSPRLLSLNPQDNHRFSLKLLQPPSSLPTAQIHTLQILSALEGGELRGALGYVERIPGPESTKARSEVRQLFPYSFTQLQKLICTWGQKDLPRLCLSPRL